MHQMPVMQMLHNLAFQLLSLFDLQSWTKYCRQVYEIKFTNLIFLWNVL